MSARTIFGCNIRPNQPRGGFTNGGHTGALNRAKRCPNARRTTEAANAFLEGRRIINAPDAFSGRQQPKTL